MFGLPLIALARSAGRDDRKIAAVRSPTPNDFILFFFKHLKCTIMRTQNVEFSPLSLDLGFFLDMHVAFLSLPQDKPWRLWKAEGSVVHKWLKYSIFRKGSYEIPSVCQEKDGDKFETSSAGTFYNEWRMEIFSVKSGELVTKFRVHSRLCLAMLATRWWILQTPPPTAQQRLG